MPAKALSFSPGRFSLAWSQTGSAASLPSPCSMAAWQHAAGSCWVLGPRERRSKAGNFVCTWVAGLLGPAGATGFRFVLLRCQRIFGGLACPSDSEERAHQVSTAPEQVRRCIYFNGHREGLQLYFLSILVPRSTETRLLPHIAACFDTCRPPVVSSSSVGATAARSSSELRYCVGFPERRAEASTASPCSCLRPKCWRLPPAHLSWKLRVKPSDMEDNGSSSTLHLLLVVSATLLACP